MAESDEEIIATIEETSGSLLVLGGGSNLVIADEGFDGTVLQIGTRGRSVIGSEVTVKAGECWDDFVTWAVDEGLAGVECLGGIPGLVGATPMQNVGAYGQDVSETIVRLRAYDRVERRVVEMTNAECTFAYRSSIFRGRDRHVILDVTFGLARQTEGKPIKYAELSKALGADRAPLEQIRSTVVELRRKKGMVLDPADHDTWSAGSFFTNPILSATELASLLEKAPKAPTFPEADGRTKVSAGWLIENAGFHKGYALPSSGASVSTKHALALTNRGTATTADVLELARTVQRGVSDRFGVKLENEPIFVGLSL